MWLEGDGPFAQVAIAYAQGVLSGGIDVCNQIKLACQRFERDLEGDDWEFRPHLVEKVCRFAELLPHVKAELAAKRETLRLEPWQVWVLANIFGFVDPKTGYRKVREVLCMVPRKNGKSTLAAVVALYMAFLDGEPGAEVWVGANSKAQAEACFVPCQQMVQRTPALAQAAGISVQAQSIFSAATGSFIKAMIAKPKDGTNPHCAILDEAHENTDTKQYDSMKTGMGARTQPLLFTITTAGTNVAGPLLRKQKQAEAVLNGQVVNDSLFAAIWTIDPDDDWQDFECWKKANPNYNVSIQERGLRLMYEDALSSPADRPDRLTKHLNSWQNSASGWIDSREWSACAFTGSDDKPALTIEDFRGKPAYLGLDLAAQKDITALEIVVQHDGMPHIFSRFFLPEGSLDGNKNAGAYRDWIDRGYVQQTGGNATDFKTVYKAIQEIMDILDVRCIVIDQWQAINMAQNLVEEFPHLEVLTFKQRPSEYNPVMREFEARLAECEIRHDDNPCMNWMASNVSIKPTANNLLFPFKPDKQDHLKIDGIVSMLMALAMYYNSPPEPEYHFAFA